MSAVAGRRVRGRRSRIPADRKLPKDACARTGCSGWPMGTPCSTSATRWSVRTRFTRSRAGAAILSRAGHAASRSMSSKGRTGRPPRSWWGAVGIGRRVDRHYRCPGNRSGGVGAREVGSPTRRGGTRPVPVGPTPVGRPGRVDLSAGAPARSPGPAHGRGPARREERRHGRGDPTPVPHHEPLALAAARRVPGHGARGVLPPERRARPPAPCSARTARSGCARRAR